MIYFLPILICSLFLLNPQIALSKEVDQTELSNIEEKIHFYKEKILSKESEKKQAHKQLGILRSQIEKNKYQLRQNQKELSHINRSLKQSKVKIQKLSQDLRFYQNQIGNHFKMMYTREHYGFLEVLFSPETFLSDGDSKYFLSKLSQIDQAKMKQIRELEAALRHEKKILETNQAERQSLYHKIQTQKDSLRGQEKNVSQSMSSLQMEIDRYKREQEILEADSERIRSMIQSDSSDQTVYYASGTFIRPAKGWISSKFGFRNHPIFKRQIKHNGIDIAAPRGHEIRATNSGKVSFSGWQKGYGNTTIIDHGSKGNKNISSIYAHQHRMIVQKGQVVKKGELIGYVGSTGYSTGPHLHFEVRENGVPVDPFQYIQ